MVDYTAQQVLTSDMPDWLMQLGLCCDEHTCHHMHGSGFVMSGHRMTQPLHITPPLPLSVHLRIGLVMHPPVHVCSCPQCVWLTSACSWCWLYTCLDKPVRFVPTPPVRISRANLSLSKVLLPAASAAVSARCSSDNPMPFAPC